MNTVPLAEQSALIDALGGPTVVAEIVSRRGGLESPLCPQAISQWRRRGIPFRYRGILAVEARDRNVNTPADFFGVGQ